MKNTLVLEIDKTRLISDEDLNRIVNEEKLKADQNLQNTMRKLQNTLVKLKRSGKKTLRLVPQKQSDNSEFKKRKQSIKKKIKKLFANVRDSSEYLNPGEKHFFCDICNNGRYFLSKLALKKHLKVHEGRMFRCSYPGCNSNFHDKNKLKRHIIIHTGEKPFKCDVCGKRFGLEFNMKIH